MGSVLGGIHGVYIYCVWWGVTGDRAGAGLIAQTIILQLFNYALISLLLLARSMRNGLGALVTIRPWTRC